MDDDLALVQNVKNEDCIEISDDNEDAAAAATAWRRAAATAGKRRADATVARHRNDAIDARRCADATAARRCADATAARRCCHCCKACKHDYTSRSWDQGQKTSLTHIECFPRRLHWNTHKCIF